MSFDASKEATVLDARRRNSGTDGRWLITFADVTAVMVAFFVLLFSMTEVNNEKWRGAVDAFDRQFRIADVQSVSRPVAQVNITQLLSEEGLDLRYLEQIVAQHAREHPGLRDARVENMGDRLLLSLPNTLLFDNASVGLKEGGREVLFLLGGTLAGLENAITVIGHSDPRPLRGTSYASNWELSLARAAQVARALAAAGYKRDIRVIGLGSGRYGELDPALSERERNSLARRVEIVIEPDTGDYR